MRAVRTLPQRKLPRVREPHRFGGFMTPLPMRREPRHDAPLVTTPEWETWHPRHAHAELPHPIQSMAVLILWLFAVLAMIALFAEFWF